MRSVVVINPMKSCRPTGIGIAADAIVNLLPVELVRTSSRFDRWFMAINDGPLPSSSKALLRLTLAQMAALAFRTELLIFATHHAPLWRTGRHAVIVYDTIPLQFPEQAPVQTSYYRRVLPRVLRCTERVVTISASVRSEFQVLGFSGMTGATVIPAWAPLIGDQQVESTAPLENSLELLFVGARYPHKNLDTVLAALEQINSKHRQPLKLVVAGCRRELWGKAWGGLEWFEQRGWVEVVERASPVQLADLYARVLALIYPSVAEGQGLPPLEAMAQGCSVICSDLPVMRETCGDAAWYIPPRDSSALARLIDDLASGRLSAEQKQKRALFQERLTIYGRAALAERWRVFLETWP